MKSNRKVLLFRGSRSKEEILLNNSLHQLRTAQIICSILKLDDSFCQKLIGVADHLKAIEDAYMQSELPALTEKDAFYRGFLERVRSVVFELINNAASEDEQILLLLAAYLPCYEAFSQSYVPTERLRTKEPYLTKVIASDSDSVLRKESSRFDEIVSPSGTANAGWNQFINYLEKPEDPYLLKTLADVIFGCSSGDSLSYASRFQNMAWELKRTQIDLHSIYVEKNRSVLDELLREMPGPRYYTNDESVFPPADVKVEKYTRIFEFDSFTELVLAELTLLNEIDRTVLQCELCGRFFVPYRTNSLYCSQPNPNYHNQPCSSIASRLAFRNAHSFYDTALGKKYSRDYKAYSKWVQCNREYLTENEYRLHHYREDHSPSEIARLIAEEIDTNWDKWTIATHAAIKQYEAGLISEDELSFQIALPKISDRSPTLKKAKDAIKRYDRG